MNRKEKVLALLEMQENLPIKIKGDYFIIEDWGTVYGEDIIIEMQFEHIAPELIFKTLDDAVEKFDIDEYVDLWAESRGKRGVPGKYSDIIHAGEEYHTMITSWRDVMKEFLDNVILKIEYLYRDAGNYKQWNTAYTKGYLTEYEIRELIESLDFGEYFIPEMVGLPEIKFDSIDPELDHMWFELNKKDITYEKPQDQPVIYSSKELLARFNEASRKGWYDRKKVMEYM